MRFFIRHKLPDACLSLRDLGENSTRVLRFELRIWRLKLPILPLNYTLSELPPPNITISAFFYGANALKLPSPSLDSFFTLRPSHYSTLFLPFGLAQNTSPALVLYPPTQSYGGCER